MESNEVHKMLDVVEKNFLHTLVELRAIVDAHDGGPRFPDPGAPAGPKINEDTFTQVGEPETGVTYTWPPDNQDHYGTFTRYRSSSGRDLGIGVAEPAMAYGEIRPYTVVHEIGSGGGMSALVVFIAADDFDKTGELLALIKGSGPKGLSMFTPGGPLPASYTSFRIERFKDRIVGPYSRNGLAVVAEQSDADTMLRHAVCQRRLRSARGQSTT